MGELAAELPIRQVAVVANKLRSPDDLAAMEEFFANHNMVVEGRVPWSDAVLDADKAGTPLIDYDPEGPVVAAVAELVQKLTAVGTAAA